MNEEAAGTWADALSALTLFAVDPTGLGGVALRAPPGPARDAWLAALARCLPPGAPVRRMPAMIGDAALLGGLDLAATLQTGRPVSSMGLLAAADGGVVILAMAERLPAGTAARLALVLESGRHHGARDGVAQDAPCRIALVALDEGIAPDERTCPALLDRLAFHADLAALSHRDLGSARPDPDQITRARAVLMGVAAPAPIIEALCGTCLSLGIGSARAPMLALRAARTAAALAGRAEIAMEDAALAARLVLAPRATRLPEPAGQAGQDSAPDTGPGGAPGQDERNDDIGGRSQDATDMLLEAARAAIPAGLLARLEAQDFRTTRPGGTGQAGARQAGTQRGRPVGVRAAPPDAAHRLNLIETLRAAAPWQRLRAAPAGTPRGRMQVRRDDFRVTRTEQRARSLTIFLVDASGSAAVARLAEAKGAVELLLADCYRRRDQVALLAFRGTRADLLLPPTRSLVRAKRSLATLPGGGGTPMAAGIDAGFLLAEAARRTGFTPTLVLLTDGRANVTRAGTGGRATAQSEAAGAARRVRAAGIAALLLDTAARPGAEAGRLAQEMGALYVPLPYANAAALSGAIRAARA